MKPSMKVWFIFRYFLFKTGWCVESSECSHHTAGYMRLLCLAPGCVRTVLLLRFTKGDILFCMINFISSRFCYFVLLVIEILNSLFVVNIQSPQDIKENVINNFLFLKHGSMNKTNTWPWFWLRTLSLVPYSVELYKYIN